MNIKILFSGSLLIFYFAYKFYTRFIERLLDVKKENTTPAHRKYDGRDYVPARHWMILFGHHFSSIAGAGPIVGPILACIWWGWLPAILWAVLGSIFIGGIHDFLSLLISTREGGESIASIAEKFISKKAGFIFLVFVWMALILVISVFAIVCARTFISDPRIVIPTLGIIPVAFIIGFLIYKMNFNLFASTILGLFSLFLLIILGNFYPLKGDYYFWITLLFIYAFFASITPVQYLLQPRDYISSFLLFFGLVTMGLGVMLHKGAINYPSLKGFISPSGGLLWPMMFITMACGAISGFHSLVASGTTSKQLPRETEAKRIGYGGMLFEGILAILVVCVLLVGITSFRVSPGSISSREALGIYSQGYDILTFSFLRGWGKFLAIIILNAFILTTLDTATRITRYVTQELFRINNKILTTAFILSVALFLLTSGRWERLWQIFGASNQLLASLTLFVVSLYLINKRKNYFFSFLPGVFMLITSAGALAIKSVAFFKKANFTLGIVSLSLTFLGVFMFGEVILKRKRL